jgi:hypothetical protein
VPDKFLPSRHGFTFDNVWPAQPAVVVPTPFGDVPFGKANGGLCGGMVFAALDYWNAGRQPPASRPPLGTPLYSFIVRRLLESWRLPGGVAKYYEWMGMPDTDAPAFQLFGRPLLTRRGIAYRTISGEWPGIRTELDRGSPVPLGVITVSSRQAKDLALNHQVLADHLPGRRQPGHLHPQPRHRRPAGARLLPHRLPGPAATVRRLTPPWPTPARSPRAGWG